MITNENVLVLLMAILAQAVLLSILLGAIRFALGVIALALKVFMVVLAVFVFLCLLAVYRFEGASACSTTPRLLSNCFEVGVKKARI